MNSTENSELKALRILVVDDSMTERALIQARLQSLGHHVEQCESGREALNWLSKNNDIDLILLDIDMPDMTGYQVAESIRMLEDKDKIEWRPIIFVSGLDSPEDIAEGIRSGGDDFLIKPVNNTILQAKISAMYRIVNMRNKLLRTQKQLELLAQIDELTQIFNRRHFLVELNREMARSRRYRNRLSIAYFDIDHFKQVNDKYGHEAGDIALKQVAGTLKEHLRSEDILGRLGGEEFCLCLPELQASQAVESCERYRKLIESLPHQTNGQTFHVTASFGVTEFNPEDDEKSLLARADKALYSAKRSGRNCIQSD